MTATSPPVPQLRAGEVGGYYNPPRMWYASIRVNFKP
jgi:hypothetical protein